MSAADGTWMSRSAAVIPCRNERPRVGRVAAGARRWVGSVIVVDDGSTDGTAAAAREAGATVVRLARNQGKGAALRAGWQAAREAGFEWAVMLDGDGQHDPEEIPRFFEMAEATGARLVIGNRMGDAASMPWLRRTANVWMSRRISRLAGAPLPDTQCGFRLGRLETLLALPLRANRFEIESDMLLAFLAAGCGVEFVPIRAIYPSDQSQIEPIADTVRWLRWLAGQRKFARACGEPGAAAD